jgi:hypothetical protein
MQNGMCSRITPRTVPVAAVRQSRELGALPHSSTNVMQPGRLKPLGFTPQGRERLYA